MKLISIHLPSNKPFHFRRLVENLVSTAADPMCFEIVVKIDIGDTAMKESVTGIKRDIQVNLQVVETPRFPSYFHTYIACNEVLRASDPDYYFCWHINDEVLIETPHWDKKLERYIDFFPDRLFRLKVNRQKMFRNFFDIREICLHADYPIVPRRWLDATENWAECHGGDTYQEGISIYLAKFGYHRNIPLLDIVVGGDEAGQNLSPEKTLARAQGTCPAWDHSLSSQMQERMARAARRVQLYINAHELQLTRFELREDAPHRLITLVQDEQIHASAIYAVDHVALGFKNFDHIARRDWPYSLWGRSLLFRLAAYCYRGVFVCAQIAMGALYLPAGLLMGIPMRALKSGTLYSEHVGAGVRPLVFGLAALRARIMRRLNLVKSWIQLHLSR